MQIDIHTHQRSGDCGILDISDGKCPLEGGWYSYGIHPLLMKGEEGVEILEEKVKDPRMIAVGEAGLDRNSAVTIDMQRTVLEKEVEISESYGLPLIIHCVRAFPELIALYKKRRPAQAWIIHGYNNNEQILDELLKHGFYISAGKKLFTEGSNILRLLPRIPSERLFLETDDSGFRIGEVYKKAAELRSVSVEVLEDEIYQNFRCVFNF